MIMRNTLILLAALIIATFGLAACQPPKTTDANSNANLGNTGDKGNVPHSGGECAEGGGEPAAAINSPIEAFSFLFEAVRSKNIDGIKQISSKATRELAQVSASSFKQSCFDSYKNGFTETVMQDKMPETRDLRTDGDVAAMEVRRADGKWENIPFVKEGNGWKLAIGDLFFGRIKSPGKAQSILEQENANARGLNNGTVNPMPNKNGNANTFQAVPVPNEPINKPLQRPRPGQPPVNQ
jgi:hypothetical protein